MGRRHVFQRRKKHRPKHSVAVVAMIQKAKHIIAMQAIPKPVKPSLWQREQERLAADPDYQASRGYYRRHRQ